MYCFTMTFSAVLLMTSVLSGETHGSNLDADELPIVFWASDPVLPDETVMLMGDSFHNGLRVLIRRLEDNTEFTSDADSDGWSIIQPLQVRNQSVKFVIPEDWEMGIFACRIVCDGVSSNTVLVNIPDPWWVQGDEGETASPGGWLRVFGKCLNFRNQSRIRLSSESGNDIVLPVSEASCYALKAELPADLASGKYKVSVHNGLGGDSGWSKLGMISIKSQQQWPTEIFDVREFGFEAALKTAENNGGGVIYFPRGRYRMEGQINLPDFTVLKGEAMGLVNLYWPDMEEPPPSLITGETFGIKDLSIYCQNYRNVISDSRDSTGVLIQRVRIRANCFFMQMEPEGEFRGRQAIQSHLRTQAALRLIGKNFKVTDCDLYASNMVLALDPHGFTKSGPRFGIIARNTIRYGGRGYRFEAIDGLIFEDNDIQGNNLTSIGNDITTFWNNSSQNLYYARNCLRHMYGADREMMTLDAGGGAYFGKAEKVDGAKLLLQSDPEFMDYAPEGRKHTDWEGAAVVILDGKGAGQYRRVVSNEGRMWEVDRPWDIDPDGSSHVSIVPFRGRYLFIGNAFQDGGAFQLYGMSIDCIIAENTGARMDGFFAWGRNPHGWGWQPSWFCQFLENEITEGNGYGHRSAFIGTFTSDNNEKYAGPLARAAIHRRNVLHNNSRIRIHGTTAGAIVEGCMIANSERGIEVGGDTDAVLLRENTFRNVADPIYGEGIGKIMNECGESRETENGRDWTRVGTLGKAPERVTDELPLSDQNNIAGWVKYEPMSDEFEGDSLDMDRWILNMSWWKGRQPALFREKNVTVSNGKLHLTMRKEKLPEEYSQHGYHDYSSAALHSRDRTCYGYFEVKAKPMDSGGSSSFWFQQDSIPGWATEIDVYEIGGKAKGYEYKVNMNLHVFRTPDEKRHWNIGGQWTAPWRLADDYHIYGLEWDEKEIKYYVDGVVVRKVQNSHWHQPLYLIFDSETMPEWFGMPADEDLPSTYSIEYVRAWKKRGMTKGKRE